MSDEKAIRVIVFDGKIENWRVWKLKYMAKATQGGYKGAIDGTLTIPNESADLDPVTGAEEIKARKANALAYSTLCLSCEGVSFGCVEKATTSELPSGDAALAWKNLCLKYEPATQMSLVSLKKEFAQCRLESVKTDPDEWVTKLEHYRVRIKGINAKAEISDEDLMVHIIANLPKQYSEFITAIENDLEQSTVTMTLENLLSRMRNYYRRKFYSENVSVKESDEVALSAFKGTCRSCGTYGHKAADCKKKEKDGKTSNSGGEKAIECNYCHKKGHKEDKCWAKKKDEKKKDKEGSAGASENADIALVSVYEPDEITLSAIVRDRDFFLCDSGATAHMTNTSDGMFDLKPIDKTVQVGNGNVVKATMVGKIKTTVLSNDGKEIPVVLNDVNLVPDLKFNLLSVGRLSKKGVAVTYDGDGAHMKLNKDTIQLKPIGNGNVYGLVVNRMMEASPVLDVGKSITVQQAHVLFGHVSEDATRKMAAAFGIKVTGSMELCDACALAKGKQKNVSKDTSVSSTRPGERLYIDLSSVNAISVGGSKYMAMIVDDHTRFKWAFFLKAKSHLTSTVESLLNELKATGKKVEFIRMDGAGENKTLAARAKELGITIEMVAPNTPQQNGVAERAIATVVSRSRAMMSAAGIPLEFKKKVWAECFHTACLLSNMTVGDDKKCPYQRFYGDDKEPKWFRHLKPFGLIGYAANRDKISSKLKDRSTKVLFMGYSDQHEGGCYRVYDLTTESIIMSRDIRWTNKFYDKSEGDDDGSDVISSGIVDDDEPKSVQNNAMENSSGGVIEAENPGATQNFYVAPSVPEPSSMSLRSGRVIGSQIDKELFDQYGSKQAAEMQKLDQLVGQIEDDTVEDVDLALVSSIYSSMREPKTFNEAMCAEDADEWKGAIGTEYGNIKSKKVWRVIKKSDIKRKCTILGTKWVFKIKGDGRYRARLVVKGYNQIPGVDYTESHSPVVNDVTIRIVLVMVLIYDWVCESIDVETAFLYGILKELVYLKIPEGFNEFSGDTATDDDVIVLDKALYGLVQACRVWVNTLIEYLLEIGFKRSRADPCLLMRSNIDGYVVFLLYVDDCMICGSRDGVKNCIADIKKRFNIKEMGALNEFVGAKYERIGKSYAISQQGMMDDFVNLFDIDNEKYQTPALPGQVLLKGTEGSTFLNEHEQSVYRSGVGKLLYVTKLSRPDMCVAVRELASFMDGATKEHWKALHRTLSYAYTTRTKVLKLEPKKIYDREIMGYCDASYASNKDDRKSVSGYAIYYMGALVSWKSKTQQCVTMSSTEAEYVAMSMCVMEMEFIRQVIESTGFEVKLPMKLYVDNVSAIELAKNYSTSGRTKHIDVRLHYIREMIDQGMLELVFVPTNSNTSDIMTKNVSTEKYKDHSHGLGVQNGEDVRDHG